MHIGLANFARPTLLILGEVASLNWLADCIEARQPIDLRASLFAKLVNVDLVITPTEDDGNLSRSGRQFNWKISSFEAQKFSEQLRALAVSAKPAHAYLDPEENSADVQLIASQGEYNAVAVLTS